MRYDNDGTAEETGETRARPEGNRETVDGSCPGRYVAWYMVSDGRRWWRNIRIVDRGDKGETGLNAEELRSFGGKANRARGEKFDAKVGCKSLPGSMADPPEKKKRCISL